MAENRAGELRQGQRRETPGASPTRRPIDDRGRQRMSPPPYDPVAFRATVEATQEGMYRRLSPGELRELREHRATPAELLTRDTVRRGVGRSELTPYELAAIHAGADPQDIIHGSNAAASTAVIPTQADNGTTSYIPKMTRLDDATIILNKIK